LVVRRELLASFEGEKFVGRFERVLAEKRLRGKQQKQGGESAENNHPVKFAFG
jgi:hypothetical protein